MKTCSYCKKAHVTVRPYGPGERLICIDCAAADPEKWAIACMYELKAQKKREPNMNIIIEARKALIPDMSVTVIPINSRGALDEPCLCDRCKAERAEQQASAN